MPRIDLLIGSFDGDDGKYSCAHFEVIYYFFLFSL
jgi:hypothetical protein